QVGLCVAIPKGKTMELVVQKAVELGVARIQPLVTERTVVKVHDAGKKQSKWQRVALEACKQCGQNVLPVVAAPQAVGDWLPGRGEGAAGLVASLAGGAREFRGVLRGFAEPPAAVDLLIGPEGDFTPEEIAAAVAAGFVPVSLGGIVLRVETAALYALSALRYEFGA
ncbi:MAG: RNA methyltransferase, partial [Akkermansiaceae bacterium]|nr:RNA methyltransferase [Akkermansiaceae bacterium]